MIIKFFDKVWGRTSRSSSNITCSSCAAEEHSDLDKCNDTLKHSRAALCAREKIISNQYRTIDTLKKEIGLLNAALRRRNRYIKELRKKINGE